MIPVEEALRRVLALVAPLPAEPVPLAEAAGRVLLEPAVATRDQPPFAASAMDGYAVIGPVRPGQVLRVIGLSQAGQRYSGALQPGEAVRIFTGAPLPEAATQVVLQEDVTRDADQITLGPDVGPHSHIREAGADFAAGHVMSAPRRLRPADLALLAAMNIARPQAARRPEVALIATGDELVLPGETAGPDQIVASNLFAIKAMAEAEGARVRVMPIARDTEAALSDVLDLARGADLIVTIGGASVGDHDLVARVTAAKGMDLAFHRVALRPGKPLMSGRLGAAAVLGLPGNPVSAILCAELFLRPMLRRLQGLPTPEPQLRHAELAVALPANGPRAHYMRARLVQEGQGPVRIWPQDNQDSAMLVTLCDSDALLVRPVNDPARTAGDRVGYLLL